MIKVDREISRNQTDEKTVVAVHVHVVITATYQPSSNVSQPTTYSRVLG